VFLVVADQLIKWWAISTLPGNEIVLIKDVFSFMYAENTGAAFSIFQNGRIFFIIVTLLLVAGAIFALAKRYFKSRWAQAALFLIIAGGLGNVIDRIFRGFVVDYLYFKLINFAIFNLADSCVVVGAIILGIVILFEKKPEENATDAFEKAAGMDVLNESELDEANAEIEAEAGEEETEEIDEAELEETDNPAESEEKTTPSEEK